MVHKLFVHRLGPPHLMEFNQICTAFKIQQGKVELLQMVSVHTPAGPPSILLHAKDFIWLSDTHSDPYAKARNLKSLIHHDIYAEQSIHAHRPSIMEGHFSKVLSKAELMYSQLAQRPNIQSNAIYFTHTAGAEAAGILTAFPQCLMQECTGEACMSDALISLMGALPRAQWILTTLGKRGSVLLQRQSDRRSNKEVGCIHCRTAT